MAISRFKIICTQLALYFCWDSDALADARLEMMISVDPSVPSIVVILIDVLID